MQRNTMTYSAACYQCLGELRAFAAGSLHAYKADVTLIQDLRRRKLFRDLGDIPLTVEDKGPYKTLKGLGQAEKSCIGALLKTFRKAPFKGPGFQRPILTVRSNNALIKDFNATKLG